MMWPVLHGAFGGHCPSQGDGHRWRKTRASAGELYFGAHQRRCNPSFATVLKVDPRLWALRLHAMPLLVEGVDQDPCPFNTAQAQNLRSGDAAAA